MALCQSPRTTRAKMIVKNPPDKPQTPARTASVFGCLCMIEFIFAEDVLNMLFLKKSS